MERTQAPIILIVFIAILVVGYFVFGGRAFDLPEGETLPLSDVAKENVTANAEFNVEESSLRSSREIFVTDDVRHSIPIDEIRQGCFGRDCISSVDEPEFIDVEEADKLFRTAGESAEDVIGIALSYNEVDRFYPFNMLVTREIVNDVIGGQPLAITYCPLCGTGIVFNRVHSGETLEFGVSGMLWQSNLLMYNRSENEENISLWSQVLGEAVLGSKTGVKLAVIPSDVVKFSDWKNNNPNGEVLDTGRIGDPYNGDYYRVAQGFAPDFDEASSPIAPTAYVFGIEIDSEFKAYENSKLSVGTTNDEFAGASLRIEKNNSGVVRIFDSKGTEPLPIVTGFWFSWIAAHPETELYE